MKKLLLPLIIVLGINFKSSAQFYRENSGEMIFGFSEVEKAAQSIDSKMRFTMFLHLGRNMHYDFSDKVGFFTGYGLRNIGIITEENEIKIKRRTYSIGVPLGLKAGSFKKHIYFYGGGEYELFFHYKQKQFIGDDKTKQSEWFSDRTKLFNPSVFGGIQFPGGINLKFKYYINDFLNRDYTGRDFGNPVDYSVFKKIKLFYISLSFHFKKGDIKKIYDPSSRTTKLTTL